MKRPLVPFALCAAVSALGHGCTETAEAGSEPAAQQAAASAGEAEIDPVFGSEVPENCDKPVYLVVWIENLDRSKTGEYAAALRESRLVARNGGKYLAVSPPDLLIEGKWPEDRGFVVERYPCREAFDNMWFSEEYQERLIPLREGSGDYTIGVFTEWPQ